MKKYGLLNTLLLLFQFTIYSQSNKLLEKIDIDSTMIIIGRYSEFDKNNTYKDFGFYIKNQNQIQLLKSTIEYSEPTNNIFQQGYYEVDIIKDYEQIESWIINPKYSNIIISGKAYSFDFEQIKTIAKKFPFKYKRSEIEFKNIEEYELKINELKKDSNLLYFHRPSFKYDGAFDITSKSKYTRPVDFILDIEKELEKLYSKKEFSIHLEASKNKIEEERTETIITIQSSNDLYLKYKSRKGIINKWIPAKYIGIFFYKLD